MTERQYVTGDLVTYCNRPAMVTFTNDTYADVLFLDTLVISTTVIDELHYLGPGQEYLRKAHEMSKLYMLIERLETLKKEQKQDGQQ